VNDDFSLAGRWQKPRLVFGALSIATLACSTTSPRVSAAPRALLAPGAAATLPNDAPLFTQELREPADEARALREHYTKYVYSVPMRDGVRLYTTAYIPKDRSRTYPLLLVRTPYSVEPYGAENAPTERNLRQLALVAPSARFVSDGYIFVQQDVRGRQMSEGAFVDVRPHRATNGPKDIDESTDAWDTIDWLVKNVPANNGRVGIWGISYPGFYAAQAAVDAHPALKAVSPQAPVTEWFIGDDFHHNGAFFVADALGFYANFGIPRPKPTMKSSWDWTTDTGDVYDFFLKLGPLANANKDYLESKIPFWNDLMQHGTRDAFWQARDPRPFYKNVKPAVLTVGGWFDAEDLWGALETYRAIERQSRNENTLVMGPWTHGGWHRNEGDHVGDVAFGAKTSLFFREKIEFPFFQRHLKGRSFAPQPEAWIFETGTNVWNAYASFPPKEAKPTTLFFHAGGKLDGAMPRAREDEAGGDTYVSDPNRPVPYFDRHSKDLDHEYMTGDQRFASRRPDVLVYTSNVLDGDVTIAGAVDADLWVTTTGTDADFVVKLVDVYPETVDDPQPNPRGVKMGGYQQLVRGEVMRGKFRNSYDKPDAFKPNEPTRIRIALPDVAHTFRNGHRIMIQVQSTWFPLVDRNPQTFVDIYQAKEADFRPATHKVIRTPEKPSSVRVMLTRGKVN
jgi:putative CocE/NonD family hydrolase